MLRAQAAMKSDDTANDVTDPPLSSETSHRRRSDFDERCRIIYDFLSFIDRKDMVECFLWLSGMRN